MSVGLGTMPIFKKVLLNGLTILVRPVENVPKVSIQLWYHVGSKDEMSGEKGNAHLIEHMIFKGTDVLSETDINAFTHKFSGYANAFTSTDYTAYIFDFPSHNWKEAFFVLSDCMRNCRFEEQMLNSELKAVIQELKMYKDNYVRSLWQAMIAAIFFDHPYHYPTIGFKQDLWSLKRDDLFAFYKKHYVPNNATLVVVGDVNPQEVFAQAEKVFGSIPKDPSYRRQQFYHSKDLMAQNVTLYRDIEQSYGLLMFVLPGACDKKEYHTSILSVVLGEGKSSVLRKKLVDDLKIVTEFSTNALSLEDATLFYMYFCPKDGHSVQEITGVIQAHLADMVKNGISKDELLRAEKLFKVGLLSALEKNSTQATTIGKDYLLVGDENYTFKMLSEKPENVEKEVVALLKNYFNPAAMHVGQVLPLTSEAKQQWKELQKISDQEDARILDGRIRTLPVEEPRYTNTLKVSEKKFFKYPRPEKFSLSNGVRVLAVENKNIPKVDLVVSLDARGESDSEKLPGLYMFMCSLMAEGTKNYPGHLFSQEAERLGISLYVTPGAIVFSFLKEDLPKALELLTELLMHATFPEDQLEKVRTTFLAQLKMYWDEPSKYAYYLASKIVYKGHPYSKCPMGTVEGISAITRKDVVEFYKTYVTAYKARIGVVGDFSGYDLKKELEKALGSWQAQEVAALHYPEVAPVKAETVTQVVNRDQVVLMFVGKSITRLDPDYNKLILFDQILSASGMASRLFKLREETGLFYSISGTIVGQADLQPGMMAISTIVSVDNVSQAKKRIIDLLETIIDSLTPEELAHAKEAILNNQINNFETNRTMVVAYLTLDRFNLPDDYFDKRAEVINAITLQEVKEAARKVLKLDEMATLQIGRV